MIASSYRCPQHDFKAGQRKNSGAYPSFCNMQERSWKAKEPVRSTIIVLAGSDSCTNHSLKSVLVVLTILREHDEFITRIPTSDDYNDCIFPQVGIGSSSYPYENPERFLMYIKYYDRSQSP